MALRWKLKYFNAIVICYEPFRAAKFRYINQSKTNQFEDYAKKNLPGAHHINYYSSFDKQFVKRVYL